MLTVLQREREVWVVREREREREEWNRGVCVCAVSLCERESRRVLLLCRCARESRRVLLLLPSRCSPVGSPLVLLIGILLGRYYELVM